MPKQKTRNSISKRFKVTKTGKVLRRGSGIRHLNVKKSRRRIRRKKVLHQVSGKVAKKLKKLL